MSGRRGTSRLARDGPRPPRLHLPEADRLHPFPWGRGSLQPGRASSLAQAKAPRQLRPPERSFRWDQRPSTRRLARPCGGCTTSTHSRSARAGLGRGGAGDDARGRSPRVGVSPSGTTARESRCLPRPIVPTAKQAWLGGAQRPARPVLVQHPDPDTIGGYGVTDGHRWCARVPDTRSRATRPVTATPTTCRAPPSRRGTSPSNSTCSEATTTRTGRRAIRVRQRPVNSGPRRSPAGRDDDGP